jgi:hypothetical protein
MWEISSLAEEVLGCQEGPCSLELYLLYIVSTDFVVTGELGTPGVWSVIYSWKLFLFNTSVLKDNSFHAQIN